MRLEDVNDERPDRCSGQSISRLQILSSIWIKWTTSAGRGRVAWLQVWATPPLHWRQQGESPNSDPTSVEIDSRNDATADAA